MGEQLAVSQCWEHVPVGLWVGMRLSRAVLVPPLQALLLLLAV